MTLETLEHRLSEQTSGRLPDGITVSPDTARRLACDATLIPVVLGGKGEVLDVGRPGHDFPAHVRRAAWTRDHGRCAFPDCTHHPEQLHHIQYKRDHGPDTLTNAAWLCAFHHWLTHEGHWHLTRDPAGDYQWTNPHGHTRTRHLDTS